MNFIYLAIFLKLFTRLLFVLQNTSSLTFFSQLQLNFECSVGPSKDFVKWLPVVQQW